MTPNYKCKYGLYHDKPCLNNEPRSNNGFIYSSYAQKIGLKLDVELIAETYNKCIGDELYFIYRLPSKPEPVISRDEIIGMVSLGLENVLRYDYNLYRENKPPSCIDYLVALKGLYKIRNEHRNYFWQNKIMSVYPLAMRLMPHDQYYVDMKIDGKSKPYKWLLFQLYAFATVMQENTSAKNVLWLQLKDLDSKFWIKYIDMKKNFAEYFGEEHVFNKQISSLK